MSEFNCWSLWRCEFYNPFNRVSPSTVVSKCEHVIVKLQRLFKLKFDKSFIWLKVQAPLLPSRRVEQAFWALIMASTRKVNLCILMRFKLYWNIKILIAAFDGHVLFIAFSINTYLQARHVRRSSGIILFIILLDNESSFFGILDRSLPAHIL